jgi:hypothetical protein
MLFYFPQPSMLGSIPVAYFHNIYIYIYIYIYVYVYVYIYVCMYVYIHIIIIFCPNIPAAHYLTQFLVQSKNVGYLSNAMHQCTK